MIRRSPAYSREKKDTSNHQHICIRYLWKLLKWTKNLRHRYQTCCPRCVIYGYIGLLVYFRWILTPCTTLIYLGLRPGDTHGAFGTWQPHAHTHTLTGVVLTSTRTYDSTAIPSESLRFKHTSPTQFAIPSETLQSNHSSLTQFAAEESSKIHHKRSTWTISYY
jgi:hypothetical protein